MSRSDVRSAIAAAHRYNRGLQSITWSDLGTRDHPRGGVVSAYRNARRAMAHILRTQSEALDRAAGFADVMSELEGSVSRHVDQALRAGIDVGRETGLRHVQIYDLPDPTQFGQFDDRMIEASRQSGMAAGLASLSRQRAYGFGLIYSEAEDPQLVGDDTHPGILNPSVTVRDVDHISADLAGLTLSEIMLSSLTLAGRGAPEMVKMAVAVIDLRTTETCRNVHGQVQPMDGLFDLDGWSPAFADQMTGPPFHHFCRTGVAFLLSSDQEIAGEIIGE